MRLTWVSLYEETGNAGLVCRRCGVSRPTLRKWWRRYQEDGIAGLKSRSRRPHNSPLKKIDQKKEKLILKMREKRNLGNRRIRNELIRNHDFHTSATVIYRSLNRNNAKPRRKARKIKRNAWWAMNVLLQ